MSIGPYAWQIVIRTIRLRRHAWRFSRYLLANPIFKTIQFSTRFWPIQACVGSWKETMIDVSSCFYYEGCNLLVFISLIQPFTAMDRLNYHRSITSEYPPLLWWCWCAASDGAERGRKCLRYCVWTKQFLSSVTLLSLPLFSNYVCITGTNSEPNSTRVHVAVRSICYQKFLLIN